MRHLRWSLALPLLAASAAFAQLPTVTISDVTRPEGTGANSQFLFTVSLSAPAAAVATVQYQTTDCTAYAKTPSNPSGDYFPASGTVTFLVGEQAKTVAVEVVADSVAESQEVFNVSLSSPVNCVLPALPQGMGQGIVNNDDGLFPLPPKYDTSAPADGRNDLLFNHLVSSKLVTWRMDGINKIDGVFLVDSDGTTQLTNEASSSLVGMADFDGNGRGDLLWQNDANGNLCWWYFNGATRSSRSCAAGDADTNWKIAGVGDFNADGTMDFFWRNQSTLAFRVWYMSNQTFLGSAVPTGTGTPDANWKIVGIGDLDADGDPDILWRHDVSKRIVYWQMTGVAKDFGDYWTPDMPGEPDLWDLTAVYDVDQDGFTDIVWRHNVSGAIVVWYTVKGFRQECGTYSNPGALADLNWKIVGPR